MARRLLNVATVTGKEEARSDFKENTDEEDTVESEDFKNNEPSPEGFYDVSSIVNSQNTIAKDESTESSKVESDSKDSSKLDGDDITAKGLFTERNGRVWVTTCLLPSGTRA